MSTALEDLKARAVAQAMRFLCGGAEALKTQPTEGKTGRATSRVNATEDVAEVIGCDCVENGESCQNRFDSQLDCGRRRTA